MVAKAKIEVRARTRPPVVEVQKLEPTLVTIAFDASVLDPEKMVAVTRQVLQARGALPDDITRRIVNEEGTVDIGECVRALMEESISALGIATGAVIGEIASYIEPIEPLEPAD